MAHHLAGSRLAAAVTPSNTYVGNRPGDRAVLWRTWPRPDGRSWPTRIAAEAVLWRWPSLLGAVPADSAGLVFHTRRDHREVGDEEGDEADGGGLGTVLRGHANQRHEQHRAREDPAGVAHPLDPHAWQGRRPVGARRIDGCCEALLPFVRRIETKSASGDTSAALYATHSTKMTHMPSHLTLPLICGTGWRLREPWAPVFRGSGGAHVSYLQQQYFEDRHDEKEEVETIGCHAKVTTRDYWVGRRGVVAGHSFAH